MSQECIFCKFGRDGSSIWENAHFFGRFDLFPVSPGHAEMIPKRHVVELSDLSATEWQVMQESLRQLMAVIETTDLKAFYESQLQNPYSLISAWFCRRALAHPRLGAKPDAYNHGLNDGRAAGRTVDHLHWHIIPRFEGDMQNPEGGVRYVIPELGNYKKLRD